MLRITFCNNEKSKDAPEFENQLEWDQLDRVSLLVVDFSFIYD